MARKADSTPPESTMQFDVAQAQASAHPASYAARYEVTADGVVVPRTSNPEEILPAVRTQTKADGTVELYIPSLAFGTAGHTSPWATATSGGSNYPLMQLAAPPESNAFGDSEFFGMWDTVLDQRDGKWNIRRAIRWWQRDPLVFSCTELLVDLSNSRVTFKSEDDDTKELVENWFKQSQPHSFRRAFFLEFFRTGYIPILKTLIDYVPRNYKSNKIPNAGKGRQIDDLTYVPARANEELVDPNLPSAHATSAIMERNKANAAAYQEALDQYEQMKENYAKGLCSAQRLDWYMNNMNAKQYTWLKGQVAGGYTILDPLLVDLKGPQSMAWLREPYLQVSGDLIAAIISPTALQQTMINKLPQEIVQQIKDGATYVWLSPNICTIVSNGKQPYERYPTPMMRHCFEALETKYDIQAMDKATVRGVKNRVLLVKIGNDTYPVTDPQTVMNVANIFNSVGRTGTFFWTHAIEMEWIEPDLSSFSNPDKFKHYNDEIRSVYGIAPVLTGVAEKGGNIGNNMMNFKGIEQRVIAAQNSYLEFLEKEIRLLKASLSLSADVQVDFERINLKDEMQFWTVVTQAVMNGILDHQTALETLGFHFPEVVARMEDMQPLKKKGLFVPSPSANNLGPDGQMKPAGAGAGGKQKNTKPPGKNKNKVGKSQPKKKAKATMKAVGSDVVVLVEGDDLDTDMRLDVAKLYGTETKWVMSVAEFTKTYPDYDLAPPWPQLDSMETMGATMAAASLCVAAEHKFDDLVKEYRQQNPGDGRGPYVTEKKKQELRTAALESVEREYFATATHVKELPKAWAKNFDPMKEAMAAQLQGMTAEQVEAHAFALTTARFKKSQV